MKKRLALIFILALLAAFACGAAVFAADDDKAESYKYRVTIYSGRQGTFSSGKVWTKEYNPGEHVEVSLKSLGHKMKNGSKYYARGFRIAGHDNDETGDTTGIQNLSFDADADVAYEVAYGLKGGMVQYTVRYVDKSGKSLRDTDTYYGMVGDKPVVSYLYVEDYVPDAYTLSKTLVKDKSKNVFTFTYSEIPENVVTRTITTPSAPGTVTNPAGSTTTNRATTVNTTANTAARNNATTANNSTNPTVRNPGTSANNNTGNNGNNGNANASDNTETVDDNDVPLAQPEQHKDLDEPETLAQKLKEHLPLVITGCVALLAIIALLIWLFLKKKKEKAETGAKKP